MPHVDQHPPGDFAWIELSTSDQAAGKYFYTSLFGWTFTDVPIGPNEAYTTFQLEGRKVAAAYTIQADEVAMGIPPHWNLYISVASADQAAGKAQELGGRVLAAPFDVMTHGRMCVLMDPTGAPFCVWEPEDHAGIEIQGQANTLCWADLSTPDPETAADFFRGLFGYRISSGEGGYLHIENGTTMIGGIQSPAHRNSDTPPHWLIYILVDDCDATTEQAQSLGASVFMGPMTMENVGRITVLADPQGAVFALFTPAERLAA